MASIRARCKLDAQRALDANHDGEDRLDSGVGEEGTTDRKESRRKLFFFQRILFRTSTSQSRWTISRTGTIIALSNHDEAFLGKSRGVFFSNFPGSLINLDVCRFAGFKMSSLHPPKKRIHLNFFENACTGSHMSPGQWRDPDDKTSGKDRLPYWLNLARLAEKGKISFIFFADSYSLFDVYSGSIAPILRAGAHSAGLDPMVIIPAMAAVTTTIGFGVTASTSYLTPYILARTLSSLDHLTEGRVAWNVVTSWSKAAAKALGADDVVPHDERYAIAHEYMDLVYKFWESSWADDAVIWDQERRTAFEPSKVKSIEHRGKYLNASTAAQTHPSPQRTPVIFQAGTSKMGREFGAKHAEAIYVGGLVPSQTAGSIAEIRAKAAAQGRDPHSLKFFVGITPILGRTIEEAQAKFERARENADVVGGLAQFSGYTGIDLARFPLDEVFELKNAPGDDSTHTFLENFNKATGNTEPWTPRRLGEVMALGGFHPAPVGTPEMVADIFEEWINEADVDGFNIAYVTSPGTFEDVVYLLRPELVKRGLMWEDYDWPGGTLRENLNGTGGQKHLRDNHYGHKFRFGNDFEGDTIEALQSSQKTYDNEVNGKELNECKINGAKRKRSDCQASDR